MGISFGPVAVAIAICWTVGAADSGAVTAVTGGVDFNPLPGVTSEGLLGFRPAM